MKINVHAGHNSHSTGAHGIIDETSENRKVAKRVIELLRQAGHTVYDCTDDDGRTSSANLQNIVKKCNAHTVDLDVSIHFNCYDGTAHGTEVWVHKGSTVRSTAQRILNNICDIGFTNRGIKETTALLVIKNTIAPALLVECCFCDSKKDANMYSCEKVARAISDGITGKSKSNEKEYKVRFQTDYPNDKYGTGTIYSSGCGPTSLVNALLNAGIADVPVRDMCAYSVSVGARIPNVGTDESILLKNASKKYGFDYKTTSKNAELIEHLKSGGVAIMNQGSAYPLFANSGHFVAAIDAVGSDKVIVADSYWYSGKYTSTSLRSNNVDVLSKGVLRTSLTQCGKATIDRAPSYYLISPKKPKVKLTEDAPIRQKASKDSKKVGTAQKGDTYELLNESSGGNWYRTKHGWIVAKKCRRVR